MYMHECVFAFPFVFNLFIQPLSLTQSLQFFYCLFMLSNNCYTIEMLLIGVKVALRYGPKNLKSFSTELPEKFG